MGGLLVTFTNLQGNSVFLKEIYNSFNQMQYFLVNSRRKGPLICKFPMQGLMLVMLLVNSLRRAMVYRKGLRPFR